MRKGGGGKEQECRKEEHTSSFASEFVAIARRSMLPNSNALLNISSFLRTLLYVGLLRYEEITSMHFNIAPRL